MDYISVLVKPASGRCNMRCEYCFYADETAHREVADYGKMSFDTLENIVKKLMGYVSGGCTLAFQGGEPTLAGMDFFRKLKELEKKYNTKNISIAHSLQTNGYILDDEWCGFFHDEGYLIGLSMDGIAGTHDRFRRGPGGEGTFERVKRSAELLKKHGVDFNILTVVNSETAPRIEEIYAYYKEQGFMWQQYIACLPPMDDVLGKYPFTLTPLQYGRFLIKLFDLWYADYYSDSPVRIRFFDNLTLNFAGARPESCELLGCCVMQNVIEADGSVYPCDFYVTDAHRLGNINTDSFGDIIDVWKTHNFAESSLNQPKECRCCRHFAVCRGGCRRLRDFDARGMNIFCKSFRMLLNQRGELLAGLAGKIQKRQ